MVTIIQDIYQNVKSHPDKEAFIFLKNGEEEFEKISYLKVWNRAISLASNFDRIGCKGKTCLVLLPSGIDYIVTILACFISRTIAVPLYPVTKRNYKVIENISLDSGASFAILSEVDPIKSRLLIENSNTLSKLELLTIQKMQSEAFKGLGNTILSIDALAFIQYTSGSTGSPKGVMLSHRNIADNLACIQSSFNVNKQSIVVSWLPFFHDMGLMGNLLLSIGSGCTCIFMPPQSFLQKPIRWLKAIEKYKATHSGGPNFSFELCIKKISPEDGSNINLSSLQVLYNGGEAVKVSTLESFITRFQDSGFLENMWRPCYGMAEATVFISVKEKFASLHLNSKWVNCGIPSRENHIIICKPDTIEKCMEGIEGEILFRGDSLFNGYYNNPEMPFIVIPHEKGDFYRTGDLGFIIDNNLYVTGRINDLIIINGKNYYPQDIEYEILSKIKSISFCATFSIETSTNAEVVIFAELNRNDANFSKRENISDKILDLLYMQFQLPVRAVILLLPGQLSRTTSGKVQRNKCKEEYLEGKSFFYKWERTAKNKPVDYSSASTRLIIQIIADKCELDIDQLNENTNFSELGINSTSIVELVEELSVRTGLDLDPTLLFEFPSIGKLADHLDGL